MISIMPGNMNDITLFVNSWMRLSSKLALSKRSSSYCCRLKALMTGRPVSTSRATRFTLSIKVCMILNLGRASTMSSMTRHTTQATASTMIQDICVLVRRISTMPPVAMMGAYSTMRKSMMVTIWICWMSLVLRVISDAAENFCTSASENPTTFSNRRLRRSRAIPAPVRLAKNETHAAQRAPSRVTPIIRAPMESR